MSWEAIAVGLTIIGMLGALAGALVAVCFAIGAFKGTSETRFNQLEDQMTTTREENHEEHVGLFAKLSEHQDRIVTLESETRRADKRSPRR